MCLSKTISSAVWLTLAFHRLLGSQRLESKSYAGEGTMYWQAPEVVLSDSLEIFEKTLDSAAADVYAYGCTVFEIYTGNHPFSELNQAGLIRAHMENRKPEFPDTTNPENFKKFRALVSSCWKSAPERPTMCYIKSSLEREIASREASGPLSSEGCTIEVTEQSTSTESLNLGASGNIVKRHVDFSDHYRLPCPYDRRTLSKNLKTKVPGLPLVISSGPAKITSSGLVTPPTNDQSQVPEFTLVFTEEPEVMKRVEDLAPTGSRLGIRTDDLLTPPETPTLSPGRPQPPRSFSSSTWLSPDSPVFVPRTGVKVPRTRDSSLNVDAVEFRPTCSLTLRTVTSSATPATSMSPLARHSSLNANANVFTPIGDKLLPPSAAFEELEMKNKQESVTSPAVETTAATPGTLTSPLARHSLLSANADEFTPRRHPIGDKLRMKTALHKQDSSELCTVGQITL
ncbi:hypothetical protein C0995_009519 [Termitomyces sp. Mi166|nr:hypothetical protein C0995_009519 [Termitomyces sp. Mi166\